MTQAQVSRDIGNHEVTIRLNRVTDDVSDVTMQHIDLRATNRSAPFMTIVNRAFDQLGKKIRGEWSSGAYRYTNRFTGSMTEAEVANHLLDLIENEHAAYHSARRSGNAPQTPVKTNKRKNFGSSRLLAFGNQRVPR